jgi:hypothetical protein
MKRGLEFRQEQLPVRSSYEHPFLQTYFWIRYRLI